MAQNLKQYVVQAPAGVPGRPTSAVTNRISLLIQNTGANPGLVRFGNPVRQEGGDLALSPGQFSPLWNIPETCPNSSMDFYSAAGTTFAVIEIVKG